LREISNVYFSHFSLVDRCAGLIKARDAERQREEEDDDDSAAVATEEENKENALNGDDEAAVEKELSKSQSK
jgi:hypothetical protein